MSITGLFYFPFLNYSVNNYFVLFSSVFCTFYPVFLSFFWDSISGYFYLFLNFICVPSSLLLKFYLRTVLHATLFRNLFLGPLHSSSIFLNLHLSICLSFSLFLKLCANTFLSFFLNLYFRWFFSSTFYINFLVPTSPFLIKLYANSLFSLRQTPSESVPIF